MNKIVMVVWGLVIVSMCALIFLIGYKQQDREYIKLSDELKTAGKSFIKDNNIKIKTGDSYIIYINELINGQYIEKNDKIEEYCIEGVVYSNEVFHDTYSIRINCKDKEILE